MKKNEFNSYLIDFDDIRCKTTLSQFRDDQVLMQINRAIINQSEILFDDILAILKNRDLLNAPIIELEKIAKLVAPYVIKNENFRNTIISFIFKNHVKYGSIPENIAFAKIFFDIDISFKHISIYDYALLISSNADENIINLLNYSYSNENVDHGYFLPIPIIRRLVQTIITPENPFRPDMTSAGADLGFLSIGLF